MHALQSRRMGFLQNLQSSPLRQRLLSAAFWTLLGSAISRALPPICMIFVARLLGSERYGELGIVQVTVNTFEVFASFGMGMTACKYVAEFRQRDPRRAGGVIVLSGLISVGTATLLAATLFLAAPWLAREVLSAPRLEWDLRISSGWLFVMGLSSAQMGVLTGFEAFRTVARLNLLTGLAAFPFTLGGCYLGGVRGGVYGLSALALLGWVAGCLAVRAEIRKAAIPITIQAAREQWRVVFLYSLPWALSSMMILPVLWWSSALLANRPGGYAQLGGFNAANQWLLALAAFPALVGRAIFPMLSERIGIKDWRTARRLFWYAVLGNAAVLVPIAAAGMIFSREIMAGFYGQEFSGHSLTLVLVLATACLSILQGPSGQVMGAAGYMWTAFFLHALWGILQCVGTYYLIDGGAEGVALARLLAGACYCLFLAAFVGRILHRRGRELRERAAAA